MSKHTEGQWEVRAYGDFTHVASGTTIIADLANDDSWEPEDGNTVPTMAKAQANAHLIAAAPELLAALRAVYSQIQYEHDKGGGIFSTRDCKVVREAIARAEGK